MPSSQGQSTSPSSSRASSAPAQPRPLAHAPTNPSGLRQSHTMSSPEDASTLLAASETMQSPEGPAENRPTSSEDQVEPDVRSRLLDCQNWERRPKYLQNYGSTTDSFVSYDPRDGFGSKYPEHADSGTVTPHSLLGDPMISASSTNLSTTQLLARQHGVKSERTMYVAANSFFFFFFSSKPAAQVPAVLPPRDELDPPISLEIPPR